MTFTSNEIAIIAIATNIAQGAVITWVTIKTQHSKDIEKDISDIKRFLLYGFILFFNLLAVVVLVSEFFSTEPITRIDLLILFCASSSIFLSLISMLGLYFISRFYKVQISIVEKVNNAIKGK